MKHTSYFMQRHFIFQIVFAVLLFTALFFAFVHISRANSLDPSNACLNMASEPDPYCTLPGAACYPTMQPTICEDNNPCTYDDCYVKPVKNLPLLMRDPNFCQFGGFCYSTAVCTHTLYCPSAGYTCPTTNTSPGNITIPGPFVCGVSPTPSLTPTPTPTISVPCVATTCNAPVPACGQVTTGKDNCSNVCTATGPVCGVSPTPTICLGGARGCPVSPTPTPSIATPLPTSTPTISPTPSSSPLNNPPVVSGIAVDQPNYCQAGLNITVNVRWAFSDAYGDTQQSYQVQLDTDPLFGTPDVDTSEVASPVHASGFIGSGALKYAKRYYARVRVRDSRGALSPWF